MRTFTSRLAGGAIMLAVTLTLPPANAAAQTGLSVSNASIVDLSNLGNNTNSCGHTSTPAATTNESTSSIANCGPVLGGTAAATATSSNATRSASAMGTATQAGTTPQTDAYGQAFSTQYSKLTVSGTPSPTDNLVFHFVTTQSETGDMNANGGFGFWGLFLVGGTNNQVFAEQTAGGPLLTSGATQTAQGFDLTMPLTPTNGTFLYNFTVDAHGYITGTATGPTTQTGSISAMLAGIDEVSGTGALVGTATFAQNGFATMGGAPVIVPPSTVPEPSSMALLGTGLFALVPVVRRKVAR